MAYRPYTIRFFKYYWHFKLTPAGKCLLASIIFSGVGTVSVQVPIYQIFFALLSLYIVAWWAGLFFRPRVSLMANAPLQIIAGKVIAFDLTIENESRRTCHDLMVGLFGLPLFVQHLNPADCISVLHPGEKATMTVRLLASRRGIYEMPPLSLHSTFPFNLFRNGSAKLKTGTLMVLPDYRPISSIELEIGNRYQPGGIALTSHIGESAEYIGNRDYIPGEPARRFDFRSWARVGKPVVREYQEEYYCRVALILDTCVDRYQNWNRDRIRAIARRLWYGKQPEIFPELEAGISLVASVAQAMAAGEYIIDLFAAGAELHAFRSGRHTAHFENVLGILSCVDACKTSPFEELTSQLVDELANVSTAVCVFLDWDDIRRRLVRSIVESGCELKVLIVRDGPTSESFLADEFDNISQLSITDVKEGTIDVL